MMSTTMESRRRLLALALLSTAVALLLMITTAEAQQVSIGFFHACAITAPLGELLCYGSTDYEESYHFLDGMPSGPFSQVSVNTFQTIALRDDGTAVGFGMISSEPAIQPPDGLLFQQVVAGATWACGVTVDGRIECWSPPALNALSFNATTAPPYLADYTWSAVSCGLDYFCGMATTGRVICYGWRWDEGSSLIITVLPLPAEDERFVAVEASQMVHTIRDTGVVSSFQEPNQLLTDDFEILPSVVGSTISSIAGGTSVTCAIKTDQIVICSDSDSGLTPPAATKFAQLAMSSFGAVGVSSGLLVGFGEIFASTIGPGGPSVQIASISMGDDFTCVLRLVTETILCFGRASASILSPSGKFKQLVSSHLNSCAIRSDDATIACWGTSSLLEQSPPLGAFLLVSVSDNFGCAIREEDNGLTCWAAPGSTQYPMTSPPSGAFSRVSCSTNYACAIRLNGTAACWGNPSNGLTNVTSDIFAEIYCGIYYSCGLTADLLQPRCWGAPTTAISLEEFWPPRDSSYSASMFSISDQGACGWSPQSGWFPRSPTSNIDGALDGVAMVMITPAPLWNTPCGVFNSTRGMTCDYLFIANRYNQLAPPGIEVGQLAPRFSYKLGRQVLPCPLGTFSLSVGSITPMCSGPCAAGRYGSTSQQPTSSCSGACPVGHYCPVHTGVPLPCPAGRFGATEGLSDFGCSGSCPLGAYCPEGTSYSSDYPCPAGRFGNSSGLIESTCSGECAAGYWCPVGSTRRNQLRCGSASVYCPVGSGEPRPLALGMVGSEPAEDVLQVLALKTQTNQRECKAGHYCDGSGSERSCATGSHQSQAGLVSCDECAIGRYAPTTGSIDCIECPPGHVSNAEGLSACVSCSPGRTNGVDNTTGLAVCDACVAGRFSEGGSACTQCPPGSYSSGESNIFCTPCSAGTSQNHPGRTSCVDCLPGSFTSGFNNTECSPCAPGSFSTGNGSSSCTPCQQGTASSVGSISTPCPACPSGWYQGAVGSTKCEKCAKRYHSGGLEGASVCTPVTCAAGHQATDESICEVCPLGQTSNDGAQCGVCGLNTYTPYRGSVCVSCTRSGMAGLTCSNGLASVRVDYWAYPVLDAELGLVVFHTSQCPQHYCPGGSLQIAATNSTEIITIQNATLSVVQCTPPRSDDGGAVLCGGCQDGYVSWSGSCVSCSSVNGGLVFLYIVLSFSLVVFLLHSGSTSSGSTSPESAGFTVILLYFVQTAMLQVGPAKSFLSWLGVFNFGSGSFSACLGPLSAYQQIQLSIFTPLILLGELSVIALLHRMLHSTQWAKRAPQQSPLDVSSDILTRVISYLQSVAARFNWSSYVGGCVSILLFCYTQVATSCIEFLHCTKVGARSVVFSQPSLDCDSSFPIFVGGFLWIRRSRQKQFDTYQKGNPEFDGEINPRLTTTDSSIGDGSAMDIQANPALAISSSALGPSSIGLSATELVSSHSRTFGSSSSFIARFGPLFVMYRPGAWYWQVSVLGRRTLFVMVSVVAAQSPGVKCLAFALLNLAALLTQQWVRPFSSVRLNLFEAAAHLFLLIIAMTLIPFAPPYSTALQSVLFILIVPQAVSLVALASKGRIETVRDQLKLRSRAQTRLEVPNESDRHPDWEATKDASDHESMTPQAGGAVVRHSVARALPPQPAAQQNNQHAGQVDLEMAEFDVGTDSQSSTL